MCTPSEDAKFVQESVKQTKEYRKRVFMEKVNCLARRPDIVQLLIDTKLVAYELPENYCMAYICLSKLVNALEVADAKVPTQF